MNSLLPVLCVHAPGIADFLKLYSAASGDQRKQRDTVGFQLLL